MINLIHCFTYSRLSWICLFLLGIILECCGLYFQYELRLPPCVNCVYERAFFLSFIIAGFLGFLSPNFFITRFLAVITFFMGSIGGLLISLDHLESYANTSLASSCKIRADFPSFLPLDSWMPWMFQPTAACDKLDWELLGLNMPQWIAITFSVGCLVGLCFFISLFFKKKRDNYINLYK